MKQAEIAAAFKEMEFERKAFQELEDEADYKAPPQRFQRRGHYFHYVDQYQVNEYLEGIRARPWSSLSYYERMDRAWAARQDERAHLGPKAWEARERERKQQG